MKHAFLIIAHNNWSQLKNLIALLDDTDNDIYVHIDKKSKNFNADEFKALTKYSTVNLYSEYKVYWGGFSLVQVEIFLFEQAFKVGYDYYHLLSGLDLPLKTNKEIHEFFAANCGKEFINFDEDKLKNDPEISRRARLYHFLQNRRRASRFKLVNGFFTICERALLAFQILFRVNRTKKLDWEIKYGSNWVSITHNLVENIINQKDKIKEVFSYTNCADELFVQTIAHNFGFADKIYINEVTNETDNMRYIDWGRGGNGNPWTFRLTDYDSLIKSDALFARKFSEKVDNEIILKITETLR